MQIMLMRGSAMVDSVKWEITNETPAGTSNFDGRWNLSCRSENGRCCEVQIGCVVR